MSSTVESAKKNGNGNPERLHRSVGAAIERGKGQAGPVPEFCPGLNSDNDPTPLDDQVGGDHYKNLAVQPFVSNFKNWGPEVAMGEVINRCYSFVATYRAGNPDFEELDKIVHEVSMLKQLAQEEANSKCQESESASCSEPCSEQKST